MKRSVFLVVVSLLLFGCGGTNRQVEFFNNTIKWVYACLPVGMKFEIKGEWADPILPVQEFITEKQVTNDPLNPKYLAFYLTALGQGEMVMPVSRQIPISKLGLVQIRRGYGHAQLVSNGPTALGIWDFDDKYALISIWPGYTVAEAQPIGVCEYLAPKRLRGTLG